MKILTSLFLSILAVSGPVYAQGSAIAEARARVVCGSGTVVSATYVPGGFLQATCSQTRPRAPQNSQNAGTNSGGLGTGGLGATPLGVSVVVVGVGLVAGSGSSGDTTGSTSTTSTVGLD